MNHEFSILDYFFFFLILGCFLNISLQVYSKYFRINKKVMEGSKLVEKYIVLENMKKRKERI